MSIIELLPPMLSGNKLDEALSVSPSYDNNIPLKSVPERLVALQDIYNVFVPNTMGREIYTKLYLSLIRSLQKKQTILAIRQASENAHRIRQQGFESIIGGADSFTIIGSSGIGKSSAISRASSILLETPILAENEKYVCKGLDLCWCHDAWYCHSYVFPGISGKQSDDEHLSCAWRNCFPGRNHP